MKASFNLSVTEYDAIFQALPDLYLVLNSNFEIVEASDAYMRAGMITRESVMGRWSRSLSCLSRPLLRTGLTDFPYPAPESTISANREHRCCFETMRIVRFFQ